MKGTEYLQRVRSRTHARTIGLAQAQGHAQGIAMLSGGAFVGVLVAFVGGGDAAFWLAIAGAVAGYLISLATRRPVLAQGRRKFELEMKALRPRLLDDWVSATRNPLEAQRRRDILRYRGAEVAMEAMAACDIDVAELGRQRVGAAGGRAPRSSSPASGRPAAKRGRTGVAAAAGVSLGAVAFESGQADTLGQDDAYRRGADEYRGQSHDFGMSHDIGMSHDTSMSHTTGMHWNNPATGLPTIDGHAGSIDIGGNSWGQDSFSNS